MLRVHGWAIGHADIGFAECVSGGGFRSWRILNGLVGLVGGEGSNDGFSGFEGCGSHLPFGSKVCSSVEHAVVGQLRTQNGLRLLTFSQKRLDARHVPFLGSLRSYF